MTNNLTREGLPLEATPVERASRAIDTIDEDIASLRLIRTATGLLGLSLAVPASIGLVVLFFLGGPDFWSRTTVVMEVLLSAASGALLGAAVVAQLAIGFLRKRMDLLHQELDAEYRKEVLGG